MRGHTRARTHARARARTHTHTLRTETGWLNANTGITDFVKSTNYMLLASTQLENKEIN